MFSRFRTIIWLRNCHYVDLFFNLLFDKSTDRRANITHSATAVLRKDFIGFTRLPWPTPVFMASPNTKSVMLWIVRSRLGRSGFAGGSGHAESRDLGGCCGGTASCRGLPACLWGAATALCSYPRRGRAATPRAHRQQRCSVP